MYAFGALGFTIGRVDGDIDPVVSWQKRVRVIESKSGGGQQANVVECMDGMCFTEGLIWWLVLLRGDRMACRICTRRRATVQNQNLVQSLNVTSRRTYEY
jgi:hypothetical protein